MDIWSAPSTSLWFSRVREVELRPEALPPIGPGEVGIRTIASALSQGTEMLVYRGEVPSDLHLDLPTLRGSFGFPIKYGYASVGRVMTLGSGVENLQVGDVVFVHHPHQTEYVVPASMAVRLPNDVDPVHGVFLANIETAVNVMLDAAPRLGERVLIFGQGVVGLLLTQLARRVGVGTIIAIEPAAARRALSLRVGADMAFEPGDDLAATVLRLTGGAGADLALEASGNGAALAGALECVTFGGTIVVCSWYGTKEVTLPLGGSFHRGRLRIVSSQVGTIDSALQPRWNRTRRMGVALDLLPSLMLEPLISHRIPFRDAAMAYEIVDRHAEETVQVVLTYEQPG